MPAVCPDSTKSLLQHTTSLSPHLHNLLHQLLVQPCGWNDASAAACCCCCCRSAARRGACCGPAGAACRCDAWQVCCGRHCRFQHRQHHTLGLVQRGLKHHTPCSMTGGFETCYVCQATPLVPESTVTCHMALCWPLCCSDWSAVSQPNKHTLPQYLPSCTTSSVSNMGRQLHSTVSCCGSSGCTTACCLNNCR